MGFGLLAVLVQYVSFSDPAEFWRQELEPMAQRFVEAGMFNQAQSVEAIDKLSGMMCGVVAAGFMLQLILSLYLARWWQALLYNPGGFGAEFRALRVHWTVGVLGLLVAAIWLIPGVELPAAASCLGAVVLSVFLLQGLAVAHGVFSGKQHPRRWLIGTYVLLLLFMPQTAMVLVTIGLLDVWIDFRTRNRRKPDG
jgi:VIT1/CCC1 family predicted Fe2+/Mn2+ transporter